MRPQILWILIIAILGGTVVFGSEQIPTINGDTVRPVIAVWREDLGLQTQNRGPFLITAIWQDGKIIWSKDSIQGGPPYYQGQIDTKVLDKALRDLEPNKTFNAPYIRKNNFGPDSFYTGMYLSYRTHTFLSRSWHELAEQNPNLVAASYGLTALHGKTREDFLKADTKDYMQYRALWQRIRKQIASLVPKQEEQKAIEFEMEDILFAVPLKTEKPH
ncbi:MAG: hypothetical protein ACE14V_00155 [bacterium]